MFDDICNGTCFVVFSFLIIILAPACIPLWIIGRMVRLVSPNTAKQWTKEYQVH